MWWRCSADSSSHAPGLLASLQRSCALSLGQLYTLISSRSSQVSFCLQVRPWLADVSADLHAPDGPLNQVEYYGLYKGRSPQPQRNPGFIMMQANLVVYDSHEGGASASS